MYLPRDLLAAAGVPADAVSVADPGRRAAVFTVVQRLLAAAEPYYESAVQGLPALPFRSAWAIAAARGVYREIGRQMLRDGPDAWNGRPVVSGGAKARRTLEGSLIAAGAVTLGRLGPRRARPDLWSPI